MLGQSEQVYVAAVPSPHTQALHLHVACIDKTVFALI